MPPQSLLDRIAEAAQQPRRWHIPDAPRERRLQADGVHFLTFPIAIDDAGLLPAFLQVGRVLPLRLGLRLPGASGREHLLDLLRLPAPRHPVSPDAWLTALPHRLARGIGPEAALRIDLARAIVSLAVLRAGRPGVRWRTLGPQIYLAQGPDDPLPLHARGGTLPAPPLRALLADALLPDPSVTEPRLWGEAADHLEGQASHASAHVRVALEVQIAEDARRILGPRRAARLLAALCR